MLQLSDAKEIRTPVIAVKGRCLNHLTMAPYFQTSKKDSDYYTKQLPELFSSDKTTPRAGLEPATPRLTAACSTIELSRNKLITSYLRIEIIHRPDHINV